jgi:cytochrome c-type biogenesis protein
LKTKGGGGLFLILIGILQVTGLWADAMNSIRGFISDFAPVV